METWHSYCKENIVALKAVKKNLSIGKALQIIEVMAAHGGPMRLQDIAAKVSQPPSTSLRFLNTLMDYGYADQNDDTLQYFLTLKFCRVGDQVSRQVRVRDVVRPFLEELSRTFEESTSLAIEQKNTVVYIDVVEGPDHLLQTLQRIGRIEPLHGTGAGKCLLLGFDDRKLEGYIKNLGPSGTTKNTIRTKEALHGELAKVRKNGYADDNEECEIGVRSVAAPIRDFSGKIVAAISTSGPVHRITPEKIKTIRTRLTETAGEISKKLGYSEK
jgi:DNA-binding IclR family transcriptional regulator